MIQWIYRTLIELTNGKWSSFILKGFAQSKLSRYIVPSFAKVYNINENEMAQPLKEYTSLHDFFVRKLKAGARSINQEQHSVASPVDAVMEDYGTISPELILTVKGKRYSVLDMLGSEEKANQYINGTYVLLYLSPSHYHRIHSPITGRVIGQWTLGRKSYPVNRYGLKYGREALSKNYRKILEVKHDSGIAAIVKVGAMFVNSIETIHNGEHVKKGEEIAYFTFGSTVILLFNQDSFAPISPLSVPADVKVGEVIGYLKN